MNIYNIDKSKFSGEDNFFDWYHNNGILPNLWKGATGQLSQEKINKENLAYQRERNKIEDARYEEETAYNRAFAEDERAYQREWAANEREYQRNLQQTIFDREDTAIARQAEALRAQGINPASQNMNGLGAGAVVSSSSPASQTSAPVLSGRGGHALQKAMITSTGINGLLAPILQTLNTIDNLKGNGIQRDVLNAQAVKAQAEANIAVMEMFNTSNRLNLNEVSFPYGAKMNKRYSFVIDPKTYSPYFYSPQMLNSIEGRLKNSQAQISEYDSKVSQLQQNRLDSIGDATKYLTEKLKNHGGDEKVLNSFTNILESLLLKAFK